MLHGRQSLQREDTVNGSLTVWHWTLLCTAAYCSNMLGTVMMLSHAELEHKLCKKLLSEPHLPGAHQGLQ